MTTVGRKECARDMQRKEYALLGYVSIWLEQTAGLAIAITKRNSHLHKSICREVQQQDHNRHGSQLNFALNTSTPKLM